MLLGLVIAACASGPPEDAVVSSITNESLLPALDGSASAAVHPCRTEAARRRRRRRRTRSSMSKDSARWASRARDEKGRLKAAPTYPSYFGSSS